MALSTKTRKRVEVALARRDAAKELCDAVDTADAGSVALTSAHILVGNASNVATDVALSGDATMANTGAMTIAAAAVTAAKINFFKSTEQTGTGSSQTVAHGLGSTPGLVIIQVTKVATAGDTFVEGAHDGTNVVVTVSSGSKFKVIAIK